MQRNELSHEDLIKIITVAYKKTNELIPVSPNLMGEDAMWEQNAENWLPEQKLHLFLARSRKNGTSDKELIKNLRIFFQDTESAEHFAAFRVNETLFGIKQPSMKQLLIKANQLKRLSDKTHHKFKEKHNPYILITTTKSVVIKDLKNIVTQYGNVPIIVKGKDKFFIYGLLENRWRLKAVKFEDQVKKSELESLFQTMPENIKHNEPYFIQPLHDKNSQNMPESLFNKIVSEKLHMIGIEVTNKEKSESIAKNAMKFCIGNCTENASMVITLLRAYAHDGKINGENLPALPDKKIRITRMRIPKPHGDHSFDVINLPDDYDPKDISTWGNAIIIDCWAKEIIDVATGKLIAADGESQEESNEKPPFCLDYIKERNQHVVVIDEGFVGEDYQDILTSSKPNAFNWKAKYSKSYDRQSDKIYFPIDKNDMIEAIENMLQESNKNNIAKNAIQNYYKDAINDGLTKKCLYSLLLSLEKSNQKYVIDSLNLKDEKIFLQTFPHDTWDNETLIEFFHNEKEFQENLFHLLSNELFFKKSLILNRSDEEKTQQGCIDFNLVYLNNNQQKKLIKKFKNELKENIINYENFVFICNQLTTENVTTFFWTILGENFFEENELVLSAEDVMKLCEANISENERLKRNNILCFVNLMWQSTMTPIEINENNVYDVIEKYGKILSIVNIYGVDDSGKFYLKALKNNLFDEINKNQDIELANYYLNNVCDLSDLESYLNVNEFAEMIQNLSDELKEKFIAENKILSKEYFSFKVNILKFIKSYKTIKAQCAAINLINYKFTNDVLIKKLKIDTNDINDIIRHYPALEKLDFLKELYDQDKISYDFYYQKLVFTITELERSLNHANHIKLFDRVKNIDNDIDQLFEKHEEILLIYIEKHILSKKILTEFDLKILTYKNYKPKIISTHERDDKNNL